MKMTRKKGAAQPVEPFDYEAAKKARLARIGESVKELQAVKFYDKSDVDCLREMVKSGICLVQIEWMLLDAKELSKRVPA